MKLNTKSSVKGEAKSDKMGGSLAKLGRPIILGFLPIFFYNFLTIFLIKTMFQKQFYPNVYYFLSTHTDTPILQPNLNHYTVAIGPFSDKGGKKVTVFIWKPPVKHFLIMYI